MTSTAQHTPTPWRIATDSEFAPADGARFKYCNGPVLVAPDGHDCEDHPIADCSCNHTCRDLDECMANAAFIVRACNNHDALVNALRDLRRRFHAACIHTGSDKEFADLACEQADAALKAAGEQT